MFGVKVAIHASRVVNGASDGVSDTIFNAVVVSFEPPSERAIFTPLTPAAVER